MPEQEVTEDTEIYNIVQSLLTYLNTDAESLIEYLLTLQTQKLEKKKYVKNPHHRVWLRQLQEIGETNEATQTTAGLAFSLREVRASNQDENKAPLTPVPTPAPPSTPLPQPNQA